MKSLKVSLVKYIVISISLIFFMMGCDDLRDEGYLKNTWMQEKVYLGKKVEVFLTFDGGGTWRARGQINDSVNMSFYDGFFTTDAKKLYLYDSQSAWNNQSPSGEYNMSIYEDWLDLGLISDSDSTRAQFIAGTWLATY